MGTMMRMAQISMVGRVETNTGKLASRRLFSSGKCPAGNAPEGL
jgi:hypothetical protein